MSGKNQPSRRMTAIVELLFPPRCHCCGGVERVSRGLCYACFGEVPFVQSPICSVCGCDFVPSQSIDHLCGGCLRHMPPFSMARAITFYEEPIATLLHAFKYNFDTAAVGPLAEIAQTFDFSPFQNCDYYLPVPLHRQRLKSRGMNQSLVITELFFPQRRARIRSDILRKSRHTIPQTGLGAAGRRKNLKNAFAVENTEVVRHKRICLVDDIFTTGTTVRECATVLRRAGAAEVMVLTFARVRERSRWK